MSREIDPEQEPNRPSKSQRKREAASLQELGVELASLEPKEIETLDLPEALGAALAELRRLRAHGALLRQRQYIGKLMRDIDPQPIRTKLDARKRRHDSEARRFQQVERWRDRLIAEPLGALEELIAAHPGADRAALADLAHRAQEERTAGRPPQAARALFALLRELLI